MKKVISILLVFVMMFSLAACSTEGEKGGETSGGEGENYDVAVIVRLTDMYGAWLKTAFENADEKYENLNITVMDNQNDNAKHMELMENCIQQQYDFIISQTPLGDFSSSFKACQDAKIATININLYQEWAESYCAQVACSEFDLGYTAAAKAAENLPEGAKVCILNGPAGMELSAERRRGVQEGLLDTRSDIELLDEQDANFEKDTAMDKTEDWIQAFDNIDGIIAASDSMVLGAVEAFKSSGKDVSACQFYGIDGLTDACNAIIDGDMTGSVLQDATKYAAVSLELVLDHINGNVNLFEGYDLLYSFEAEYIDSSNAQKQLDYFKDNGLID